MQVTLIQRPTEVKLNRKTILRDGRQVGYFHGHGAPLLFTVHMDPEEAGAIKQEVERIEGVNVGKCAIPPPTPPEWLEESGLAAEEDEEY